MNPIGAFHYLKTFDVMPFADGRYKTPIEGIRTTTDGAISPQQVVKLHQCLNQIDALEKHLHEIEGEILRLPDYSLYSHYLPFCLIPCLFRNSPIVRIPSADTGFTHLPEYI